MLQFYFLSILLNLVAGLVFIYAMTDDGLEAAEELSDTPDADADLNPDGEADALSEKTKPVRTAGIKSAAVSFLGDKTLQLVVGILSFLTGLMKLLSPIQYDIAIIGDLVPALAGIAAGAVLLLDWYQERSDSELPLPDAILTMYTSGRKYLGIFCVIAAVLHFIFPRVLFL